MNHLAEELLYLDPTHSISTKGYRLGWTESIHLRTAQFIILA